MDIIIRNSDNQPIYAQIYRQIRDQIIAGHLKGGDLLPSIRALAKDLKISVITTKRAYDELEQEGYVYTVAGKGCFVAQRNTEFIREENLKKIDSLLQEALKLAKSCSLSSSELAELIQIMAKEE